MKPELVSKERQKGIWLDQLIMGEDEYEHCKQTQSGWSWIKVGFDRGFRAALKELEIGRVIEIEVPIGYEVPEFKGWASDTNEDCIFWFDDGSEAKCCRLTGASCSDTCPLKEKGAVLVRPKGRVT